MKISDLTGILKTHRLPLLKSYPAGNDCVVFEFDTKDSSTHWKPGQHGIFTLPKKNISGRKWRAFSVSSIPEENMLQIATKISNNPSSFKTALNSLKPGEKITVRGPYGWLYLKDHNSPIVMIAGGIGITPFRSLLKELEANNHRDVKLIYSARDKYLFKEEIDSISSKDDLIQIFYTPEKEETKELIDEIAKKSTQDTYYFISGSPQMINSTIKQLKKLNIPNNKIITDSFKGY